MYERDKTQVYQTDQPLDRAPVSQSTLEPESSTVSERRSHRGVY